MNSDDQEVAFYAIPACSMTFDNQESAQQNRGSHKLITKALRTSTKKKHLFKIDSLDSSHYSNSKIHRSFSKE